MDPSFLVRGLLIGLSVAAPVGPIGVLCIRRTLAEGRLTGLLTGLGAATADAAYGAVAAFGITLVTNTLVGQQTWIRLFGGIFLCYLGLRTILTPPAENPASATGRTLLRAYTSALALTLTNPLTILSFAAIFAGVGTGTGGKPAGSAVVLVLGVLLGSALWWVILSGGVSMLRAKITPRVLRWINRISGGLLLGFGLLAFASL